MPHRELEYQYFMENVILNQQIDGFHNEVMIKAFGLNIRNDIFRYKSVETYVKYNRKMLIVEEFMAQDV
jgi:hypothetical protein